MIDPRQLATQQLDTFDLAAVASDLPGFDQDDPLVLERQRLTSRDMEVLRGVPIELDRCVIAGCDLSNFVICGIKNSIVQDSKLRGTRFLGYVRNTVFERCQLHECVLRMAKLERVSFDQSTLAGCDFYGSELATIWFPGTEFEGVGFDRCTLDKVDLTQATDLRIGDPRTLVGAAVCETQVPLIASRLVELSGIEVRDC